MKTAALFALLAAGAVPGAAQVDPTPRRLIQAGYETTYKGPNPPQAYLFYYTNQPNFIKKDISLRAALAPTYVDGELGFKGALGEHCDLGLGLAGGGFADNYYEIRQGHYFKEESFNGYGATASLSVYPLFNPDQKIPLSGVYRLSVHGATYAGTSHTASAFQLPADHIEGQLRAGLRLGGQPPRLRPMQAAELSAWYEGLLRDRAGSYGFGDDRDLNRQPNYFWTRGLINLMVGGRRYIEATAQAGASANADRISTFRLGGQLPFSGEFPLELPGYYAGELTARRFALFGAAYGAPIMPEDLLWSRFFFDAANVTFLPGEEQAHSWYESAGAGFRIETPGRAWLFEFDFAHAFQAIRSAGRGADSVAFLTQLDLRALQKQAGVEPHRFTPGATSNLEWLGGLFR